MNRRVCDQLSENFRDLRGRLQFVSPSNAGTSAAQAQSFAHVLADGCRDGD